VKLKNTMAKLLIREFNQLLYNSLNGFERTVVV